MPEDKKKKRWTEGRQFTKSTNEGYDVYTPQGDHTDFNIIGVGDKRKVAPVGFNLKGYDVNSLPDLDTDNYENNLGFLKDLQGQVDKEKYIQRADLFTPFGDTKNVALEQGWYPSESSSDHTIFQNRYNGPFNDVVIPVKGQAQPEKGSIALIGKKGNKFDIIVRRQNGDIDSYIQKDATPQDVQDYIQNKQSTIQQRVDKIQAKNKPQ